MFSRRHPFLFFAMVIAAIPAIAMVMTVAILVGGSAIFSSSISSSFDQAKGNIGVVEIFGVIASSKEVSRQIKLFRDDPAIKAIVLRIDSPGGGVGPSQEIYREIVKAREVKKVVASLGSVAASGGYYAASAADAIVANPGTITGSIGVILEYANFQKIMEKIGLTPVVIKSGEYKDIGSPVRKITPEEKAILQGVADEVHLQFVRDVAKGRSLELDKVAKLADGRIYTGEKALGLNLVDKLGNLEDSLDWTAEMAGIKGKVVPVYPKEKRLGILKELISTLFKQVNISGTMTDYFRYILN